MSITNFEGDYSINTNFSYNLNYGGDHYNSIYNDDNLTYDDSNLNYGDDYNSIYADYNYTYDFNNNEEG